MDDRTKEALEAAVFRRLVSHLQQHTDELTWPQLVGGIGKLGLQLDCPGRRVDLIVDAF